MNINLWNTGKPVVEGQYVIIAKSLFDSKSAGIRKGETYIFVADWYIEDNEWVGFTTDKYEVLWWRPLRQIALCLPMQLEGEELHYW